MPIRVLPEQVASAIAAGEVVERPASVVKELIENALDAGATRIEIRVEGGGHGLIEVADNGSGILAAEVPLAVARFATSKLDSVEDLEAIDTLGFRGEALASMGAVARLEIQTRAAAESVGARLEVEGGRTLVHEPVGAPAGTLVRVRDLFYNVPARRKFLKTEATERRWITEVVSRYALAYPQVQFQLHHESKLHMGTTGRGDPLEALTAVYGVEVARALLPIREEGAGPLRIRGFVSPPDVHRSNRRQLTFFVNGRWIHDPSLAAAIRQAYHGLLMVGRHPMAVLQLELPAQDVDVNVHPTKAEVRFRDPGRVFAVLQRAVRATLLGQTTPPRVRYAPADRPAGDGEQGRIGLDWAAAASVRGVEPAGLHPAPGRPGAAAGGLPLLRVVGQVSASYVVAEGPDGIYLVDQHAAHERILFERLMHAHQTERIESQALLEPQTVEFPPAQASLLESQLEILQKLGFQLEHFGGRAFRVRAVPELLRDLSPEQALRSVVEDFEEDETPLAEELEARVAARVCKRAAVKAGQVLSLQEQERLLMDLEACAAPRTCPHGRPTMIHLPVEALERQFGRRG